MTLKTLAEQTWIEARSGVTPLDSERAVAILLAGLTEINAEYSAKLDAETAAREASDAKCCEFRCAIKKLVKVLRETCDRCPGCGVADTQRHTDKCWVRAVAHPVWTTDAGKMKVAG